MNDPQNRMNPTDAELLASAEAAYRKHALFCLACIAAPEAAACGDRCQIGSALLAQVTALACGGRGVCVKTSAPETVTLVELYGLTGCTRSTFPAWAFQARVQKSDRAVISERTGRAISVYTRADVLAIRAAKEKSGIKLPPLPKGW